MRKQFNKNDKLLVLSIRNKGKCCLSEQLIKIKNYSGFHYCSKECRKHLKLYPMIPEYYSRAFCFKCDSTMQALTIFCGIHYAFIHIQNIINWETQ